MKAQLSENNKNREGGRTIGNRPRDASFQIERMQIRDSRKLYLPGLQLGHDRLVLGGLGESRFPEGSLEFPSGDLRRPSLLVQLGSHVRQILAQSSRPLLEPLYRFPQSRRIAPSRARFAGPRHPRVLMRQARHRGSLILLPSQTRQRRVLPVLRMLGGLPLGERLTEGEKT